MPINPTDGEALDTWPFPSYAKLKLAEGVAVKHEKKAHLLEVEDEVHQNEVKMRISSAWGRRVENYLSMLVKRTEPSTWMRIVRWAYKPAMSPFQWRYVIDLASRVGIKPIHPSFSSRTMTSLARTVPFGYWDV